jgi:hypothetical protein
VLPSSWGAPLPRQRACCYDDSLRRAPFEVRDHDAPVKYVFNGATRVARVTGSLASVRRTQRVRVNRGWNLLSIAVSMTNALQQIGTDSVRPWDRDAHFTGGTDLELEGVGLRSAAAGWRGSLASFLQQLFVLPEWILHRSSKQEFACRRRLCPQRRA